jgi:glucose/arabinose dehydrogenase/mono/diheme cytochrome c family protein
MKLHWVAALVFGSFISGTTFFDTTAPVLSPESKIILSDTAGFRNPQLEVTSVISGLNVPWEITWGPDNWIWMTEQSGTICRVNPNTGEKKVLVTIPDVLRLRTLGLLGLAFHPDFKKTPFLYTDYTFRKDSVTIATKLVRYTYKNGLLVNPKILLEVAGHTGHNGSRITISPDRKIMFATGDAITITNAQSLTSPNGKVLRLNLDGSIPADNPIKGSPIWSWGHRNIQGLVYGPNGILYSSEHGDASDDEVNIIQKGLNYGWPRVEGFCDTPKEKAFCDSVKVTEPVKAWTPTIAPAGIDFYTGATFPEWKNSLLLTTLKEADLRVLKLDKSGKQIIAEHIILDGEYGRLRDVCIAPNGDIYVSTSNRDWNPGTGFPKKNDDHLLRIRRSKKPAQTSTKPIAKTELYQLYCASCHKEDGTGIPGTFPPLKGTEQVNGSHDTLLKIMLKGLSGPIIVNGEEYDQQMPGFAFLSDSDLATIATYIRSNFGNKSPAVTPADVGKTRASTN